jgi:predicted TPR repeat methyltransferase
MDSTKYWIDRYLNGGNSGAGSDGRLNVFKSEFLNSILKRYEIESILDFGCGEGAILRNLIAKQYMGYDPSEKVIQGLKEQYLYDKSKSFESDLTRVKSQDLVISFDVIFHLIEDLVYENYMNSIFSYSKKYVLIYSSNTDRSDPEFATAPHVRHRYFEKDIPKQFILHEQRDNLFPYQPENPSETSWSNFYLYKRV